MYEWELSILYDGDTLKTPWLKISWLRRLDILIRTKSVIQESRKQSVVLYEQIRGNINESTYIYDLMRRLAHAIDLAPLYKFITRALIYRVSKKKRYGNSTGCCASQT
jgi:hypothetical protein